MRITQFYPEAIQDKPFISQMTLEPGGIFIRRNSQLYYNVDEVILVVSSSTHKITRDDIPYKFKSINGEEIVIIKSREINSNSNISEKISYAIRNEKIKISKSDKSNLIKDVESSLLESLIDSALTERNEELFNILVGKHRKKNLQLDISS